MIFRDKVHLKIQKVEFVAGTRKTVTVYEGDVPATVTYLDPKIVFDPQGNKMHSRLQIFLKPFGEDIPSDATVKMSWRDFADISPEGKVEPFYRNGRLHHYEIIAAAFT